MPLSEFFMFACGVSVYTTGRYFIKTQATRTESDMITIILIILAVYKEIIIFST